MYDITCCISRDQSDPIKVLFIAHWLKMCPPQDINLGRWNAHRAKNLVRANQNLTPRTKKYARVRFQLEIWKSLGNLAQKTHRRKLRPGVWVSLERWDLIPCLSCLVAQCPTENGRFYLELPLGKMESGLKFENPVADSDRAYSNNGTLIWYSAVTKDEKKWHFELMKGVGKTANLVFHGCGRLDMRLVRSATTVSLLGWDPESESVPFFLRTESCSPMEYVASGG